MGGLYFLHLGSNQLTGKLLRAIIVAKTFWRCSRTPFVLRADLTLSPDMLLFVDRRHSGVARKFRLPAEGRPLLQPT